MCQDVNKVSTLEQWWVGGFEGTREDKLVALELPKWSKYKEMGISDNVFTHKNY